MDWYINLLVHIYERYAYYHLLPFSLSLLQLSLFFDDMTFSHLKKKEERENIPNNEIKRCPKKIVKTSLFKITAKVAMVQIKMWQHAVLIHPKQLISTFSSFKKGWLKVYTLEIVSIKYHSDYWCLAKEKWDKLILFVQICICASFPFVFHSFIMALSYLEN